MKHRIEEHRREEKRTEQNKMTDIGCGHSETKAAEAVAHTMRIPWILLQCASEYRREIFRRAHVAKFGASSRKYIAVQAEKSQTAWLSVIRL